MDTKTVNHQRSITAKLGKDELQQWISACAESGVITEWVIRNGTFYERLVWAMALAAAASESDEDFDHGEQVEEWGKTDTENLRKALRRLLKKIETWMKKTDIRIPA